MVLILEVPFAAIAFVLSVLSWKTLKTIKYLGVGKSFWIPVLMSAIFFFVGSVAAIVIDLGVSFTYDVEVISVVRLLGLCILLGGVSTYSRKITKNLGEKFIIPTRAVEVESEEQEEIPQSIVEKIDEKKPTKEFKCKYNFGYLQTLPRSTAIPDECISCHRIIECKHST